MSAREVFAKSADPFIRYEVELVVRDKLIGGVPKDPDTIKKWLESRVQAGADIALQEEMQRVAEQMEGEPSFGELMDEVARNVAQGNGFKTVDGQLMYEGRCLKAGLKEAANVAYPGTEFPGKPKGIKKGLMRYMAERVFVEDQYIPLGVSVPTGTEQRIKHVMTPQGPRSAINVVDFVEQPKLTFSIAVLDDCLTPEVWGRVWMTLEEIGIGADRARSDGKFDLLKWQELPG